MKLNFKNLLILFIVLTGINALLGSVGVPGGILALIAFGITFYSEHLGLPVVDKEDKDAN